MFQTQSLTKTILDSSILEDGILQNSDGSISKAFVIDLVPSGLFEEGFQGEKSDSYLSKLSQLLAKLPNLSKTQWILARKKVNQEIHGWITKLYCIEKIQKTSSFSHIQSVFQELDLQFDLLKQVEFKTLLSSVFGKSILENKLPDLIWHKDHIEVGKNAIKTLSITELPQVTWNNCLQALYEYDEEFYISIHIEVPDRIRVKKQLETKRRVSHALSISSSLEVRNIESNSVLHSSEEILERILIGKETLFEASIGLVLSGELKIVENISKEMERIVSGIGNAGLFTESIGTLPVLQSHLPGAKPLKIRKLPILSENLSQILPLFHDYTRNHEKNSLELRSRSHETSYLNLFSKENLNYNSFICGASGSGKSFLMNSIISSQLKDHPNTKLCIFDIGGSYRNIIHSHSGKTKTLSEKSALEFIATFIKNYPIDSNKFYSNFLEILCGSGTHISHSHKVALEEILREMDGSTLEIKRFIEIAKSHKEKYYLDLAHWLKPHIKLDDASTNQELLELIRARVSAFDFKELDSNLILQKSTILLLSELIWKDLLDGRFDKTLIVFDEVWRFFSESKDFLEEMYRTLRKYKAGIVTITQNLADYGDDAFSKMLFTNSYTKIFLQNGATAEYLKNTFDLPHTDIERALSVTSKKPIYSEFFSLSPQMSQVFRLYPTQAFYELANTENITKKEIENEI